MDLVIHKTTYIFIEESTILENGFISKIKKIIDTELRTKQNQIKILMDVDIDTVIQNLYKNGSKKQSYLLDGFVDIIKYYGLHSQVETNSYLDVKEILEKMSTPKDAKRYVFTQKETVFNSLKVLKESIDVDIVKFQGDTFIEWVVETKNLKAFYLDTDYYMAKVDTSNLEYAYSPKFGYLKLDHNSKKTGGEGTVYKTYNNFMAKIYHTDNISYINFKKLAMMIDMDIYNPFICWPKDFLYDENHSFVGYLMDEITDAITLLTLRLENFNEYNHLQRFILCYNLMKNLKYLHDKNILVGDLKPDNILVKSPEEVYFIDCGCYQIGDYACPVCHPEYTKRVFKNNELKEQLRTLEDEYYPINKLAFEILIRKNHTYSPNHLDIENQDKNQFHYPLDVSNIVPESEDMAIWCVLTQSMREYFYYYFKENRITDLSTWCNELKLFINKLTNN